MRGVYNVLNQIAKDLLKQGPVTELLIQVFRVDLINRDLFLRHFRLKVQQHRFNQLLQTAVLLRYRLEAQLSQLSHTLQSHVFQLVFAAEAPKLCAVHLDLS